MFQNELLGEVINPYDSSNSTHYFNDIICDGDVIVPLLTVINFKSSKFLQINADNVGIYFNDILKVKNARELERDYFINDWVLNLEYLILIFIFY